MSIVTEEEIKRWTARRKSALVLEVIQGKASISEASRQFDLPPSEIDGWGGAIAFVLGADCAGASSFLLSLNCSSAS